MIDICKARSARRFTPRLLAGSAALLVVLGLAGCGQGGGRQASANAGTQPKQGSSLSASQASSGNSGDNGPSSQAKLTRVTLTTNWYAEPSHGGFYEAKANGLYRKRGLSVDIKMGGPQVNNLQLLVSGKTDFIIGFGIRAISAVQQGLPVVTVAAIFQKDPTCILAHPGVESLADLKGKPIAVASSANTTFWPWLQYKYGFSDAQKRPYQFSVAPFLANPKLSQQAYITSEPYAVEQKANFKPQIFLLADYGYPPYSTTIATTESMVKNHPEIVQKFVDASIEGWQEYLKNPTKGDELIKKADSGMTQGQMRYGVQKIKQYQLATGGDAATQGIGTMTNSHWRKIDEFMKKANMIGPHVDYKKAYTLKFVEQARKDLHEAGTGTP